MIKEFKILHEDIGNSYYIMIKRVKFLFFSSKWQYVTKDDKGKIILFFNTENDATAHLLTHYI